MKNKVEKMGMYIGIILAVVTLIIPIILKIEFLAVIQSTVLFLSLTVAMYLRKGDKNEKETNTTGEGK